MALSINLEDHYYYTLLKIEGTIDVASSHMLDRAIISASCEGNRHLILDCSQLFSITSDGLRVLLEAYKNLCLFYTLTLCNVNKPIQALFSLSGVSRYLSVVRNLDEAEAMLLERDIF